MNDALSSTIDFDETFLSVDDIDSTLFDAIDAASLEVIDSRVSVPNVLDAIHTRGGAVEVKVEGGSSTGGGIPRQINLVGGHVEITSVVGAGSGDVLRDGMTLIVCLTGIPCIGSGAVCEIFQPSHEETDLLRTVAHGSCAEEIVLIVLFALYQLLVGTSFEEVGSG